MDETFLIKLLARLDTYIHIACYAAVYTAACLLKDPYNNNNSSCSCRRWIPADTHTYRKVDLPKTLLSEGHHIPKNTRRIRKEEKKGQSIKRVALFFFFFFSQTLVVVFIIFLYDEMIFKDCLRVLLLTLVFFYRSNWIASLLRRTGREERSIDGNANLFKTRTGKRSWWLHLRTCVDGLFYLKKNWK